MARYKIQDDNGEIYTGDEIEMDNIFSIMTSPEEYSKEEVDRYKYDWTGDLELVEIKAVVR